MKADSAGKTMETAKFFKNSTNAITYASTRLTSIFTALSKNVFIHRISKIFRPDACPVYYFSPTKSESEKLHLGRDWWIVWEPFGSRWSSKELLRSLCRTLVLQNRARPSCLHFPYIFEYAKALIGPPGIPDPARQEETRAWNLLAALYFPRSEFRVRNLMFGEFKMDVFTCCFSGVFLYLWLYI